MELFGNSHPVEIEIGCGKGAFLVESALANPDIDFLGIERQLRWVRRVEERLARRRIANARVLCADAALVVERFVPSESVRAYHLYFPDPWWKKRHHKRRLVQGGFPAALYRTLERGGRLHLATDVEERFAAMIEELAGLPFAVTIGSLPAGRPATNFERKYRAEGRPIWSATLEKRG